jgi:hypothetical protein
MAVGFALLTLCSTQTSDPAVAAATDAGPNRRLHEIGLDAAPGSAHLGVELDQDLVPSEAKLQWLGRLVQRVWLHPSPNLLHAFDHRLAARRDELDFGMKVLDGGVEVTATVGVEKPPQPLDDLGVFLRHRARSISRRNAALQQAPCKGALIATRRRSVAPA